MKGDPEQRAVQLGEYIAANRATVRAAAAVFGCSKSTVHKDVAVRLRTLQPELFRQVRAVLACNKAERHLRGGAATRRKYCRRGRQTRAPLPGRARLFYCPVWNCASAPFSSRDTCA